ncbi:MAG TPA: hypothetical protein VMW35_14230 [Myxococcota bacterium]|jgi:hypothetical protein|nr:hypothetical protein [Myxococcota bacterium]
MEHRDETRLERTGQDLLAARTLSSDAWRFGRALVRLREAAERGQRSAFDRAFDVCFSIVYRIALRLAARDQGRAERITTGIFLAAMRSFGYTMPSSSPRNPPDVSRADEP